MSTISEIIAAYDRLHSVTDNDRKDWVPVDYAAKLAQAKPVPAKKKDS
jgi:hypothetical protein